MLNINDDDDDEVVLEAAFRKTHWNVILLDNYSGYACLGSSFGNFLAIHLARYRHCGDVKKTGLFGLPRMCIFTSEEVLKINKQF